MKFRLFLIFLFSIFLIYGGNMSIALKNANAKVYGYAKPPKKKKKKTKKSIYKRKKKPKKKSYSKLPLPINDTTVLRKTYPTDNWDKNVFKDLTLDEKIGQLFMVAAYSNRGKEHVDQITSLIKNYNIGGLLFFQGGPYRQAQLTNYYQRISKIPLFIAIDGEWGVSMRLDSCIIYPKQMTLGAIQNDELIYQMGGQIANECERLGIHINFAPVADVNNNIKNPVIGFRSFGEDKENVSNKAIAYMLGMQDNNIIACGKHFPGHGDTETDSHKELPVINHNSTRIDTLELIPFKNMFKEGLMSIMVGHIKMPYYDTAKFIGASLSNNISTKLLRDTLQFKGLSFTDALDMKGVSTYFKQGEVALKALLAGSDVLLNVEDVPTAHKLIKQAIDSCLISEDEIDLRVKKILNAKKWSGLNFYEPVETKNLGQDLNSRQGNVLNKRLFGASQTLIKNSNDILPLKNLDTLLIASLSIGDEKRNAMQSAIDLYGECKHFNLSAKSGLIIKDSILNAIKPYNLVLVSLDNLIRKPDNNFGLTSDWIEFINKLSNQNKVILNVPGSPYCLINNNLIEKCQAVVIGYERNDITAAQFAELIFGGRTAPGKLPVSINKDYTAGTGITNTKITRLQFIEPEEMGINLSYLSKIDSIAEAAIIKGAFPGCQILAAKDGKVFLNKSYGKLNYQEQEKNSVNAIYDIASVTKVAASALAMMKLVERNKLNIDDKYSTHLAELKGTNKESLTIKDQLAHFGKLKAYLPYYTETIDTAKTKVKWYSKFPDENFTVKVADSIYALKFLPDTFYKKLIESPLNEKRNYLYSDIGYYFLKKLVEQKSKVPFQIFLDSIYKKMGMNYTMFNPTEKNKIYIIAPTELDKKFRKQLIKGYVHDQGAAISGGVAGHAGLFSNAVDLAKYFQMLINKGEYGGETILKKSVVNEFIHCVYCKEGNRRGLAFDKPEPNPKKDSPCSKKASLDSFGHSGFTGTFAWADPENGLLYIFLSNRVCPDASNNKIIEMGVRTKIQDVLYDAVDHLEK